MGRGHTSSRLPPQHGRIYATPADGFSVTNAVRAIWEDKTGLMMAIFAYLVVFVPLYTSMFTNMAGLRSSTIDTDGTLLYWLGQHDFKRGEQPWFYFLLLLAAIRLHRRHPGRAC